jgi:hypothetical protein
VGIHPFLGGVATSAGSRAGRRISQFCRNGCPRRSGQHGCRKPHAPAAANGSYPHQHENAAAETPPTACQKASGGQLRRRSPGERSDIRVLLARMSPALMRAAIASQDAMGVGAARKFCIV